MDRRALKRREQREQRERRERRERAKAFAAEAAIAGVAKVGAIISGAYKLAKRAFNQVTSNPDNEPGPSRPPVRPAEPPVRPPRHPRRPDEYLKPIVSQSDIDGYDILSDQINAKYTSQRQTLLTAKTKEAFRHKLEQVLTQADISTLTKPLSVHIIGSSETSELALDDSDLDLCVTTRRLIYDHERNSTLESMRIAIRGLDELTINPQIIGRWNPVVQFRIFRPSQACIKVDLQAYNIGSLRNTYLVANYIRADARFQKLALILKLWARKKGIDGTMRGLSSYAIVLMLIHYLQVKCDPPVLPCLHQTNPSIFNPNSDPNQMKDFQTNFTSLNKQNLGDLLIGFFRYYSQDFDFTTMAVTVTNGRALARSEEQCDHGEFIFVGDPFTCKCVALSRNRGKCENVISCLKLGFDELDLIRDLAALLRSLPEPQKIIHNS